MEKLFHAYAILPQARMRESCLFLSFVHVIFNMYITSFFEVLSLKNLVLLRLISFCIQLHLRIDGTS